MRCDAPKVDHVNSHPTYALGGLEEAPGPPVSLVLPVTNCASGLCQAFSGCHVPYQGGSTLSRFHCHPLTLIKKVFWIITLGTLSNHWPWNISSFLETLFLRKGCQKPSPSVADQEGSARGSRPKTHLQALLTEDKMNKQPRASVMFRGVIPTEPPPFFLGKCQVSCGLCTDLGEDEMSAVTALPGLTPLTVPPYYYLKWHFGY